MLLELSAGDTRAGVLTPRPAWAGGGRGWVRPPPPLLPPPLLPAYGQSEMVLDMDVERSRKGTLKEDIFSWDGAAAAAVTSFGGTGGRAGWEEEGDAGDTDEEVQGRVGSTSPTGDGLGDNDSNEHCLKPLPPCPCPSSLLLVGDRKRMSLWRRSGEKYSGGSSTGVGWGCNVLGLAADDIGELDSGVFRIWWSTKFGWVVGIGRWSFGGDGTVVFVLVL